jgi:hypothetical protein
MSGTIRTSKEIQGYPLVSFFANTSSCTGENGGSYVVLVPSWLVIADRAVADDARLLVDVHVRRTDVPELLVWMLQGHAQ